VNKILVNLVFTILIFFKFSIANAITFGGNGNYDTGNYSIVEF